MLSLKCFFEVAEELIKGERGVLDNAITPVLEGDNAITL